MKHLKRLFIGIVILGLVLLVIFLLSIIKINWEVLFGVLASVLWLVVVYLVGMGAEEEYEAYKYYKK